MFCNKMWNLTIGELFVFSSNSSNRNQFPLWNCYAAHQITIHLKLLNLLEIFCPSFEHYLGPLYPYQYKSWLKRNLLYTGIISWICASNKANTIACFTPFVERRKKEGHVTCKPGAEGDKAVYQCSVQRGYLHKPRGTWNLASCVYTEALTVSFWLETDSNMVCLEHSPV